MFQAFFHLPVFCGLLLVVSVFMFYECCVSIIGVTIKLIYVIYPLYDIGVVEMKNVMTQMDETLRRINRVAKELASTNLFKEASG